MTSVTLRPGGPLLSGAVYGCLLNVQDELDRLGDAINEAPYNGAPTGPVMYVKTPNTQVADGTPVVIPADVDQVRVGATLGVVIKDTLTRADAEQALAGIAGYTIYTAEGSVWPKNTVNTTPCWTAPRQTRKAVVRG